MEREALAKQIGRKLTEAREEIGLSRAEVGQRLGLTERGYGHIEAGRSLIGLDHLLQLPNIFGKPLTSFLPAHAVTNSERNSPLLDPLLQELITLWPDVPPAVRANLLNVLRVFLADKAKLAKGETLEY